MFYISYGSVCELEAQILLAGDLGFIEKGKLDIAKTNLAEIGSMLKALIQSLENKYLNPGSLESLAPILQLNWRRTFHKYM